MQGYVNYYTRCIMNNKDDNPPIGIVSCSNKSEIIVKNGLYEQNSKIFSSKYKHYLSTKDNCVVNLNVNIKN